MINRYKAANAIAVTPDDNGQFVLYDDCMNMLSWFIDAAVEAGADKDLLEKHFGEKHEENNIIVN